MKSLSRYLMGALLALACPAGFASPAHATVWESETPCEAIQEVMSYTGQSADLLTGVRLKLSRARLVLIPNDLSAADGYVLIPVNSFDQDLFRKFYELTDGSCLPSGEIRLFNRELWALEGRSLDTNAAWHYGSTHIIVLKSLRRIDHIPLATPPAGYSFGIYIMGYGGIGDF